MAALMAIEQGYQVALMAPTEILARQHADTIYKLLGNVGYGDKVSLLIGGLKPKQKQLAHQKIKNGEIKMIVGTHALISEKVDMHKLGLIIIDEQHRFGVEQRKKLQAKAGHMPHVLHMTATPIPRSLALTLYGELDISILDEMPPGSKANHRYQQNDFGLEPVLVWSLQGRRQHAGRRHQPGRHRRLSGLRQVRRLAGRVLRDLQHLLRGQPQLRGRQDVRL